MTQRLEQYRCSVCEGQVVVMRGGSGIPMCCGHIMALHAETPEEAVARRDLVARGKAVTEQMPVRRCEVCGVTVVVFNPSRGPLMCCEQPMQVSAADGEAISKMEPLVVPPMEYNLTMPVKFMLAFIQQRLGTSRYFGIRTEKCPFDFWVYQEMIFELQPDVIIEIGNFLGGALLAYAHQLDHMGRGRVIGVDIENRISAPAVCAHPRVTLITGDACERFEDVRRLIHDDEKVLVIEDSSHTYENTLNVLRTYCGLVAPGGYFIVEDSNCHHGVEIGPSPGPYEAIIDFVKEHPEFESDRSRESFFITWNPMGYLRRKTAG